MTSRLKEQMAEIQGRLDRIEGLNSILEIVAQSDHIGLKDEKVKSQLIEWLTDYVKQMTVILEGDDPNPTIPKRPQTAPAIQTSSPTPTPAPAGAPSNEVSVTELIASLDENLPFVDKYQGFRGREVIIAPAVPGQQTLEGKVIGLDEPNLYIKLTTGQTIKVPPGKIVG